MTIESEVHELQAALRAVADEMHIANLIALAHVPPMYKNHGQYPRRERAFRKAADRLGVDS